LEAARKKRDKAQQEADAAEKKRIADLKRDRESLLKTIESESQARIKIAKDLGRELRDLQISAIQDQTERLLAAERERFERQKAQNQTNLNILFDQSVKNEAKIIALFGEGSVQLAQFQKESGKQLLEIQAQTIAINERQAQEHQDKLTQITKDGEATRLAAEKQAFEDEIAATEAEYDELERIEGERSDQIIAKQIEAEKKAIEERKKASEARVAATKDTTINLVSATLQALGDISQAAFDAEQARFDDAIEKRQANISKLNEDLANATGLQKKFLEDQIKQEQKALDEQTKAKEEARKKQAIDNQIIAVKEALIAAALGVANAFSLPPPASFIAAAATAVATGAQIAVIASQKFDQ
jgi:hypothetical protein